MSFLLATCGQIGYCYAYETLKTKPYEENRSNH